MSRSTSAHRLRLRSRVLPSLMLAAIAAAARPTSAAAPLAARPHGNALGDGLQWDAGAPGPSQAKVCAAGATTPGIDVSYYQGNIDWNAVAASGVVFAWVRVSHSTQFEDPKFAANLAGARAAGIHTGVYQYFEPTQDPIAQADLLIAKLGPLQPGDMPPMIDVEAADKPSKAAYADAIRAWIDRVEKATGVAPFIYTGYYYWNDYVATGEFADHPLWIANYNPGCPLVPDVWSTWTMHQYSSSGSVPGIAGNVDMNYFNGSPDDLMGYAVGGAVCGDAKCVFGEGPVDCPEDCPPCGVVPPEGGVIDNGDACLELGGDLQYWRDEAVGYGGSLVWTNATDDATPSNYATWRLFFAESGTYAVEAWIEPPFNETKQLTYKIKHAGGETAVPVDQSAVSEWVSLGEFAFDAASDHLVRIDDNTGEPNGLEVSIVCDALRVTRVDLPGDTSTGGATTGDGMTTTTTAGPTSEGASASGDAPTTSGTGGDPPGGTTGGSGSGAPGLPPGFGQEDDGCGCNEAPGPGGAGLLALVGLALARRRRRR